MCVQSTANRTATQQSPSPSHTFITREIRHDSHFGDDSAPHGDYWQSIHLSAAYKFFTELILFFTFDGDPVFWNDFVRHPADRTNAACSVALVVYFFMTAGALELTRSVTSALLYATRRYVGFQLNLAKDITLEAVNLITMAVQVALAICTLLVYTLAHSLRTLLQCAWSPRAALSVCLARATLAALIAVRMAIVVVAAVLSGMLARIVRLSSATQTLAERHTVTHCTHSLASLRCATSPPGAQVKHAHRPPSKRVG